MDKTKEDTNYDSYSNEFLHTWFPKLPANIIENVCGYLCPETIKDTLLKAPELRNVIIDCYYSKEITLWLTPKEIRIGFCCPEPIFRSSDPMDLVSSKDIEGFLLDYPDIDPHLIKVKAYNSFNLMAKTLRKFYSRLAQAPSLEIYIDEDNIELSELALLMSFPNLFKLHLSGVYLNVSVNELSSLLGISQSLKHMILRSERLDFRGYVKLPPNLTHLDLNWNSTWCNDFADYVTPMCSEKFLQSLFFLSSIKVLKIKDAGLEKSISLAYNLLEESSLKQLSGIAWPEFLETLDLRGARINLLEHLSSLPQYIKHLNLSRSLITGFKVTHNDDGYPFFRFPECLEKLEMKSIKIIGDEFSPDSTIHGGIPLEQRLQFPHCLKFLNLDFCRSFLNLADVVFPPSLEILILRSNEIHDLTSYNLTVGTEEIVNWTHLINLKKLNLMFNSIENLENWCPPKSLREVELYGNCIRRLTKCNTPLFSERFRDYTNNITMLGFRSNPVAIIDEDLVLPRNLKTLKLSPSDLKEFVFTDEIASHKTLTNIELIGENIERIFVKSPGHTSQLKSFSFSSRRFQMTTEDFYDIFRQLGLAITKKPENIYTEHVFE
ncbi:hypothetical protein JCM33374_g429 [Metschnikowia sp. JCM 33374]|nr:hypothetical protein JCM33374_g429 [Metschnikowia sp. JCM 33374]